MVSCVKYLKAIREVVQSLKLLQSNSKLYKIGLTFIDIIWDNKTIYKQK